MTSIISAFAKHRIAPNLLILLMILSGYAVLDRLEVRFFPKFDIQVITVTATWKGAATEDVSDSLLIPLENELRNVPDQSNLYSYANEGGGVVYLEFEESVDLNKAKTETQRYLDLAVSKLPAGAELPEIKAVEQRDDIMRLSLSGDTLEDLRLLARRLEKELLRLGGFNVDIKGLADNEIQIIIQQKKLTELQLSLRDIGSQIGDKNIKRSAGEIKNGENTKILRTLTQKKNIEGIANLPLFDAQGNVFRLKEIAEIKKTSNQNDLIFFNGKPSVEFLLTRKSGENAIAIADTILEWVEETKATLPPSVGLTAHRERWRTIESRLDLLIENGLQGIVLVLLMLLIFLNFRLSMWVAVGIPATFMVALCVLYFSDHSINMISMFALIMVTGIVVDDAIVVSENANYHFEQGLSPTDAAVTGAIEMFPAVFASTFTTIASFLPLIIVGGTIGAIIFAIPLVVVCVLLASFFECFFVLPGHLKSAFYKMKHHQQNRTQQLGWLHHFQENFFRRSVSLSLRYDWVTIAIAITLLVLTISLVIGGLLKYRFFPGAELNRVSAQVNFVAGTSTEEVDNFIDRLQNSLHETATEFPKEERLIRYISVYMGSGGRNQASGDEKAQLVVELSQPNERSIRTSEFVSAWRKRLPQATGLESLSLRESKGGPAGEDLEISLTGSTPQKLKEASQVLQAALLDIPGINRPKDDMPYGKNQIIFKLNSLGKALNLDSRTVANQLRDSFDGFLIQKLYEGQEETEVRILLEEKQSHNLAGIRLRLPNGKFIDISDVITIETQKGFDIIQRKNAQPIVNVVANVDFEQTSQDTVIRQLEQSILPDIVSQYGISYSFEGTRADQKKTVEDMQIGLIIALVSIFAILAAVFSSWSLPLVIILTIPFGVIGAMWGHWLLGYEFSILSAFGLFTLNGIIVNDSIILVRDYLHRLKKSPTMNQNSLIVDTVCRRFRAILLTSVTTIGGLIPLIFESSTQAQFLIPMAISICFGLSSASFIILYLVPALLSVHNKFLSLLPTANKLTP